MAVIEFDNSKFQVFLDALESIKADIKPLSSNGGRNKNQDKDVQALETLARNFKLKTEDFYRTERKLNIGVVGQVKAGKSSFLNTLLFGGRDVLPKASTPKTATLTKIEYAPVNAIQVEYYSPEDWTELEASASSDFDDEITTSARELVDMVQRNNFDPHKYLEKGSDVYEFSSYEELAARLNDYVGDNGKFTPIVKAVTLKIDKAELEGFSIVDTPGLNDPIVSRTVRTKEFIEVCDVVFFLSQSGSFLDKSDWDLLSTQLPQKGVRRLVLIASKYDSGLRDVLRVQDPDDIFGEDESSSDNIPGACKIVKSKLTRRARSKVKEFIEDLEMRGMDSLISVIQECQNPVPVSAMTTNMSGKDPSEYTDEERNVAAALKPFSKDLVSDLKHVGNFDQVRKIFDEVVADKQAILDEKARTFVPNAVAECRDLIQGFIARATKLAEILKVNDRDKLEKQRRAIERQMGKIKNAIASLFSEWCVKLEDEKSNAISEMSKVSHKYLEIREYTGSEQVSYQYNEDYDVVVSDSKWYNPFSWFSNHTETRTRTRTGTRTEQYKYCIVSDVVENLNRYAFSSTERIISLLSSAIQLKDMRRRLLNLVLENFDLGNENYDVSLLNIMVEETVNQVTFPTFSMDISSEMNTITSNFSGEIRGNGLTKLRVAIGQTLSKIYDKLSSKMADKVKDFKSELTQISKTVQDNLLENIKAEFDTMVAQCADKDREIAQYGAYIEQLKKALDMLDKIK